MPADFQIVPTHCFLVDPDSWWLIFGCPDHLITTVRSSRGSVSVWFWRLRNLRFFSVFLVHGNDEHEHDDQRQQHVDQGVTLI